MKLKYITLISFFVFVGAIVVLAFLPVGTINNPLTNNPSNTDNLNNTNTLENPNNSNGATNLPTVTLTKEEIAKHSTKADCYLIVKGAVYSVSSFIDSHPGGAQKIMEQCGGEATALFSAIHSNFAWNLLKNYYIGNVGASINTAVINTVNTNQNIEALKNLPNKNDDDGGKEDDD